MDIVSTVVHQLTEEIQFLTAVLKLCRLTQLEDVVACPYHGFGGHEETVEPVHCRVVPELHRHRRLMLQLFVSTSCHVSTHVEVSGGVNKHDLEGIVKVCK